MKVLRALSLMLGLAALALTGSYLNQAIGMRWNWQLIWNTIFYWPRSIVHPAGYPQLLSNPQLASKLNPLAWGYLFTHISAVILSIALAKSLNRSRWDWGILSFLFPYLAPTILVFHKKSPEGERGVARRLVSAMFGAGSTGTVLSSASKNCGRCGKEVPLDARAGERCPHCGAYWSTERTIRR
jgi:hypothetical protein